MPVSKALQRLLRIRDLEEEQLKLALDSAVGELHSLQNALTTAIGRAQAGRQLVDSGARSGEMTDRQSGLVEAYAGELYAAAIEPRIEAAEAETVRLRQLYLEKRIERRQAETLIEETEARDAVEANRKSQDALDDWYRSRQYSSSLQPDSNAKAQPERAASDARPEEPEL